MFGIYVCFFDLHQDFQLMQMDLSLDLELGMGNNFKLILAEVWSQLK